MPRRKPDGKTVIVQRYELGDFERRQLEDMKIAYAVKSASPIVGAGLVAAGLLGAGFLIDKTFDDLKEFWDNGKEELFGLGHTEQEMQQAVQNSPAVTNQGAVPNIDPEEFPGVPDFDGMSPSAIYNTMYEARSWIINHEFSKYCERRGLEETGFNFAHFRDNATGLLASRPRATTTVNEGEEISMFTYQMCIRETAARRNQGRSATGVFGAVTTGWGLLASEGVWRLGNALGLGQSTNWSSGDVTEAPGYIDDTLLTWCRTIVDFPGVDAATLGTYTFAGFFTRSSNAHGEGLFNIGSKAYVEDILKIKSRLQNPNPNRDIPMWQYLSDMWPDPPS